MRYRTVDMLMVVGTVLARGLFAEAIRGRSHGTCTRRWGQAARAGGRRRPLKASPAALGPEAPYLPLVQPPEVKTGVGNGASEP